MNFDLTPAVEQMRLMVIGLIERLPYMAIGFVVFIVFYFLAGLLKSLVRQLAARSRLSTSAALILSRLAQWTTVTLGLFVALVVVLPGFTPSQLVQLLGVGSVAVGFAFRDILQNFLAGILILLTEPFRLGDQIVVNEFEGTVEDIETRATTIRTYDGRRVVIPNAQLFTESVIVNTAFDMRRVQYDIGIGYDSDIEFAKQVILDAMRGLERIAQNPPPDVLVVELAEYSVVLRVRWWIGPASRAEAMLTQDLVLSTLKKQLEANDIEIPFPTRQLLFQNQSIQLEGSASVPGTPESENEGDQVFLAARVDGRASARVEQQSRGGRGEAP